MCSTILCFNFSIERSRRVFDKLLFEMTPSYHSAQFFAKPLHLFRRQFAFVLVLNCLNERFNDAAVVFLLLSN